MHTQKKEVFTKEDILKFIFETTAMLGIEKNDLHILLRWNDKLLNKSFWTSEPNSFYNLMRIPTLYFDINNVRSGGAEIIYNKHTDTMSLTCIVNELNNNKIFDNIPTHYNKTIILNDDKIEEVWSIDKLINRKKSRVITLTKIDSVLTQATSVLNELNEYQNYNLSILDKDLTFNFDVNSNFELIINKLKITYYMEKNINMFKDVTSNASIHDILNDTEENIKNYVKILEMCNI
jgi:hypothetical protein